MTLKLEARMYVDTIKRNCTNCTIGKKGQVWGKSVIIYDSTRFIHNVPIE